MRSLRSFLPDPYDEKTKVIQARVSPELAREVKRVASMNGWSPSEVIRAGLMKFLEDEKPRQETLNLKRALDPSNVSAWK